MRKIQSTETFWNEIREDLYRFTSNNRGGSLAEAAERQPYKNEDVVARLMHSFLKTKDNEHPTKLFKLRDNFLGPYRLSGRGVEAPLNEVLSRRFHEKGFAKQISGQTTGHAQCLSWSRRARQPLKLLYCFMNLRRFMTLQIKWVKFAFVLQMK